MLLALLLAYAYLQLLVGGVTLCAPRDYAARIGRGVPRWAVLSVYPGIILAKKIRGTRW